MFLKFPSYSFPVSEHLEFIGEDVLKTKFVSKEGTKRENTSSCFLNFDVKPENITRSWKKK
jgi:hypothetical protein